MAKAGGAIPSWFWPSGIPRRVPVPQQPFPRLLDRVTKANGSAAALVTPRGTKTYGELFGEAQALAARLQAAGPRPATVAIEERDIGRALEMAIAVWMSGSAVLLLDPDASTDGVAKLCEAAQCPFVLVDGGVAHVAGVEKRAVGELPAAAGVVKPGNQRVMDRMVLLPTRGDAVIHSHFSVMGMASALTAFIPELKEAPAWCGAPPWSWEGLVPAVSALLNGGTVVVPDASSLHAQAPDGLRRGYTILRADVATALLRDGHVPPHLRTLAHVFVSVGAFTLRWRRDLERLLGRRVLTLWGLPETGPAVAAHPTWAPPQAHGFPMVNVTLLPIDPGTGQVSVVPWGMLDRAEIGVEAAAAPAGFLSAELNQRLRHGKVLRTGQMAMIDNVGVVVLV